MTGEIEEFAGITIHPEPKNTFFVPSPTFGTLAAGWWRQMFRTKTQRDAAVSTFIADLIAENPNHPSIDWYVRQARYQFPLRDTAQLIELIAQEMTRAHKTDHEKAVRKFIESAVRKGLGDLCLFKVRTVIDGCVNDVRRMPLSESLTDDELTHIADHALIDMIQSDILDRSAAANHICRDPL